eukprot:1301727-Prymnesium_polylepis.2
MKPSQPRSKPIVMSVADAVGPSAAPGGKDGLAEVQDKLDAAKSVMGDNVGVMLTNLDKASALDKSSEELAQSATQCVPRATQTSRSILFIRRDRLC